MRPIPGWVRVGAKCVCIHAADHGPRLNEICTIIATVVDEHGCYLYLDGHDEWVRVGQCTRQRFSYAAESFRPLVTLEDDIAAHFRALLNAPAPTERERA